MTQTYDVAIVGVFNTEQARVLEGHDSRSITFAAGMGAPATVPSGTVAARRGPPVFGRDFCEWKIEVGADWRSDLRRCLRASYQNSREFPPGAAANFDHPIRADHETPLERDDCPHGARNRGVVSNFAIDLAGIDL